MQRGDVYLSAAEEEFVEALQNQLGVTEILAVEKVVAHKRDSAFMWAAKGYPELAEQLLKEIGQWELYGSNLPIKKKIVGPDGNPL